MRVVLMVLALSMVTLPGCRRVKKKVRALQPIASIAGITILEASDRHLVVRVDVKTSNIDLLLGFVSLRYHVTLTQAKVVDLAGIDKNGVQNLKRSGFSFVATIPLDKGGRDPNKRDVAYRIDGTIVVKVIKDLARLSFKHKGTFTIPE